MNFHPLKVFRNLVVFIKDVSKDPRIPDRDKVVLAALVALIISPFDIIPDWIPVFGLLDDIVILALVLDYLFRVLDSELLLSHYPWGMKSFLRIKRASTFISKLAPGFLKDRLWSYTQSPYK